MVHNLTTVDWLIVALAGLIVIRILAAADLSFFEAVITVAFMTAIGWRVICQLYP